MSYFRRLRGSGSDDEETPAVEGGEPSLERFMPYSVRAGDETPRPEADRAPDSGPPGSLEPATSGDVAAAGADPAVYDQVGEHVSTVLSSADEAAKRLQESARTEAERIRAEAETYAAEMRASADAYAEERRENAETEAAAIVAEAEGRSGELREAAEREAAEIQRDAVRRRESLFEESERAEERLRNILQVFRTMTERLEELVGGGGAAEVPRAGRATAEHDLSETLVAATEERRAAES